MFPTSLNAALISKSYSLFFRNLSNFKYTAGITNKVNSVATETPKTIAVAIDRVNSDPGPVAKAEGMAPKMKVDSTSYEKP